MLFNSIFSEFFRFFSEFSRIFSPFFNELATKCKWNHVTSEIKKIEIHCSFSYWNEGRDLCKWTSGGVSLSDTDGSGGAQFFLLHLDDFKIGNPSETFIHCREQRSGVSRRCLIAYTRKFFFKKLLKLNFWKISKLNEMKSVLCCFFI